MIIGNKKINLSVLSLILVNIQPLIGVLFFNWSPFSVLVIYWFESVIIGFYNILKMIVAQLNPSKDIVGKAKFPNIAIKCFFIIFFIFHYGLFMSVHFIFINIILNFSNFSTAFPENFGRFLLLLFISHGISFLENFIGKKEYKKISLNKLMDEPYLRVTLMQIVIIVGGAAAIIVGNGKFIIGIFVILKIFIDLLSHNKQHKKYQMAEMVMS